MRNKYFIIKTEYLTEKIKNAIKDYNFHIEYLSDINDELIECLAKIYVEIDKEDSNDTVELCEKILTIINTNKLSELIMAYANEIKVILSDCEDENK